jgi:hypothetical protein
VNTYAREGGRFAFVLPRVCFLWIQGRRRRARGRSQRFAGYLDGDDEGDLASQFATLVTVEQVLKAVIVLGNEDGDARTIGSVSDSPAHLKVAGDRSKMFGKLGEIESEICRIEFDSRQKKIRFFVSMLVGEEDVTVVPKNKVGNGGDDPFPVGAGN